MNEIEIKPPLKDWTRPIWREFVTRYAGHVAIKKRGDWSGFADAWDDEMPMPRTYISISGGYRLLPSERLQGFLGRLGENAHRVIVREICVENRPATLDALLAEAGVKVKSPYAAWTKGKTRRFLDENGRHHPSHILVKVTKGSRWWSLDDRARELIGDYFVAHNLNTGYAVVRSGCVGRLLEGFRDQLDRLEFRRLPEPPAT
ncbi:hypothetical protein [Nonomuraea sp. B19D2]|uniref:hypothetical protein n=1 Tax=Nonomuraea sp. B19D2 TaxID=3159561 RepID=UPI0032DA6882